MSVRPKQSSDKYIYVDHTIIIIIAINIRHEYIYIYRHRAFVLLGLLSSTIIICIRMLVEAAI